MRDSKRFKAAVSVPGSWWTNGYLSIRPGELACTRTTLKSPLGRNGTVVHSQPIVHIYVTRLMIPWSNVSILIVGAESMVIARRSPLGLARLVNAIESAGFQVEVHRTGGYYPGPDFPDVPRT